KSSDTPRTSRSSRAASLSESEPARARSAKKGVLLSGNEFLSAATVLCTIGTRPNPLVERTLLTVERGRIVVNADLGVKDFAGLALVARLLLIADADAGPQAPDLHRMDMGHVFPQRHHAFALHAKRRAGFTTDDRAG